MTPPGSLAVEFTHTSTTERDKLPDYAALLAWAEQEGAIGPDAAKRLTARAAADPRHAKRVHVEAVALRDALYALMSALSEGRPADARDVATLNDALHRAAAHRHLVEGPEGYRWRFSEDDADALDSPLWRVAQSAAELLTSDWAGRIGVCAADTCRWLFVDESRNKSRRWCDMSDCGTREKVRRFRKREKAKGTPETGPSAPAGS